MFDEFLLNAKRFLNNSRWWMDHTSFQPSHVMAGWVQIRDHFKFIQRLLVHKSCYFKSSFSHCSLLMLGCYTYNPTVDGSEIPRPTTVWMVLKPCK